MSIKATILCAVYDGSFFTDGFEDFRKMAVRTSCETKPIEPLMRAVVTTLLHCGRESTNAVVKKLVSCTDRRVVGRETVFGIRWFGSVYLKEVRSVLGAREALCIRNDAA